MGFTAVWLSGSSGSSHQVNGTLPGLSQSGCTETVRLRAADGEVRPTGRSDRRWLRVRLGSGWGCPGQGRGLCSEPQRTQPTKADGDLRCPGWGPGRGEPAENPSAVPSSPRSPGPSCLSMAPRPTSPTLTACARRRVGRSAGRPL